MNAKTPQKKTNTQIETTIFCAVAIPKRFATRTSATSNKTLFHCFVMYSPGACPSSINCASHALYTWLAKSPASILLCHTQGMRISAETAKTATICHLENPSSAGSLPSASVGFSFKPSLASVTPDPAAFYYLLIVAHALICGCRASARLRARTHPRLGRGAGSKSSSLAVMLLGSLVFAETLQAIAQTPLQRRG